MKAPLWAPSEAVVKDANLTQFIEKVNQKYGKDFKTYDDLYQCDRMCIPMANNLHGDSIQIYRRSQGDRYKSILRSIYIPLPYYCHVPSTARVLEPEGALPWLPVTRTVATPVLLTSVIS